MSIFSDANSVLVSSSLGQTVTYKGTGALTEEINGIYRDRYLRVDPETEIGIQTDEKNVYIVLADLSKEPDKNDLFEIDSVSYRVDGLEKDAHGGAYVLLSET
jgi:hypothetical protein